MRKLLPILGAVIVIAFIALGINNIVSKNNELHLKEIQLKDVNTKLLELESKYDVLNKDLDKANSDKNTSQSQIDQLNKEKADLEQSKKSLESQLQAKIDAKNKLAQAPVKVLDEVTNTQAAAAASVPLVAGSAKAFIYQHESGNNPGSINANSGACGLGQALPCSKLPCSLSDYVCQDNWFTNSYMVPRYGTWENAMAFWVSHGWW